MASCHTSPGYILHHFYNHVTAKLRHQTQAQDPQRARCPALLTCPGEAFGVSILFEWKMAEIPNKKREPYQYVYAYKYRYTFFGMFLLDHS